MIGTTLAHYRITAALGAGGMGEVWRATDEKLGREVALKVLPAEFAADPDRLARFEREAKVLASLNHPNIAHLYGLESVNTRMAAGTAAPQGSQADGKGLVGHASRVPYTDASREAHAPKGVGRRLVFCHPKRDRTLPFCHPERAQRAEGSGWGFQASSFR